MVREYRHHNVKRSKGDITEAVGQAAVDVNLLETNKELTQMSSFFTLHWKDVGGIVVSAVLVAVFGLILQAGDIFIVDWKQALNIGVMAGIARFLEALLTTQEGKFIGAIPTK